MALSTCRDCNREVSTLARHCVHCGRPRPAGVSPGSVVGTIIAVAIAIALTGAVICAAKRCRKMSVKTGWECRDVRAGERKPCGSHLIEVKQAPAAPQEDLK